MSVFKLSPKIFLINLSWYNLIFLILFHLIWYQWQLDLAYQYKYLIFHWRILLLLTIFKKITIDPPAGTLYRPILTFASGFVPINNALFYYNIIDAIAIFSYVKYGSIPTT